MTRARVLIADDHEVVRRGIRSLLENQPSWEVCGEAVTGREAVEKTIQLTPDVVVLDVGMPELNGLEAARQILKVLPHTEILILTMHDSTQLIHEVLAAGARGYVLKSDAGRDLVAAVDALCRHKPFFAPSISGVVLDGFRKNANGASAPTSADPLTAREREILQLLAEGKSNKDVATILGISVKTAETHRTNVMRKLELHSVSELVRYAIRNSIIEA